MTDVENADDTAVAETVDGTPRLFTIPGYYLAPSGDLWELTDEGWYVNAEWAGSLADTEVPEGLQRLLTGNQWVTRVRQRAAERMNQPISAEGELVLRDTLQDDLFTEEPLWINELGSLRGQAQVTVQDGDGFSMMEITVDLQQAPGTAHPTWLTEESRRAREADAGDIMDASATDSIRLARKRVADDSDQHRGTPRWIRKLAGRA